MKSKSLLTLAIAFAIFVCAQSLLAQTEIIGPLVGHTDTNSTHIWARMTTEGEYTLEIKSEKRTLQKLQADALIVNDLCVTWKVENLAPATQYQYQIKKGKEIIVQGSELNFKTAPSTMSKTPVHLAFGSGSSYTEGTGQVWDRISQSNIDGMVLLGDTPYIDATDFDTQRSKYREFSSFTPFQDFAQSKPFWGTWDDHDFAYNDSDGTAKGKENSLKVFKEFRPNGSFGDGNEGVYTRFEYGAAEVFLLDTRWWSYTGPSFADSTQKTLLGKTQWE